MKRDKPGPGETLATAVQMLIGGLAVAGVLWLCLPIMVRGVFG